MNPKQRAHKRFEQLNHIVDKLLPKLPSTQGLALMVFYRHADVSRRFRISERQLAKTLGIHRRTARRLFDDLEAKQAIRLVEPRQGTIPRVFVITGKVASGDTRAPTKPIPSGRSHVL